MSLLRSVLTLIILLALAPAGHAQHAQPPSTMPMELCECIGSIDLSGSDRDLDLAVRHCLNMVMAKHSREVVGLLQRYPGRDRAFFLLGQLLGSSLDRTCPQYLVIKDRLHLLVTDQPATLPST